MRALWARVWQIFEAQSKRNQQICLRKGPVIGRSSMADTFIRIQQVFKIFWTSHVLGIIIWLQPTWCNIFFEQFRVKLQSDAAIAKLNHFCRLLVKKNSTNNKNSRKIFHNRNNNIVHKNSHLIYKNLHDLHNKYFVESTERLVVDWTVLKIRHRLFANKKYEQFTIIKHSYWYLNLCKRDNFDICKTIVSYEMPFQTHFWLMLCNFFHLIISSTQVKSSKPFLNLIAIC